MPLWNRNQGNIATAAAQIGEANQLVGRVENELSEKVATAFRDYASARQRAERYRESILPRAKVTYELSFKAYQGGQFEYLRVLEAQRAMAQANLDYPCDVRSVESSEYYLRLDARGSMAGRNCGTCLAEGREANAVIRGTWHNETNSVKSLAETKDKMATKPIQIQALQAT